MKNKLLTYSFYLLVLTFFVITILKLDLSILTYLSKFNMPTVLLLLFLQCLTIVIISHQWFTLTKAFTPDVSFFKIVELNVIGTFTESITPAVKTGGEGVKLILLNKNFNLQYNEGVSVILVQKAVSSTVFILLFLTSLAYTRFEFTLDPLHCVMFLITLLTIFLGYFFFFPRNFKTKFKIFKEKVGTNIRGFRTKKLLITYLVLNNFIVWLGYPIKLYIITRVFNLDLSFLQLSSVIFVTYGVSMLPTTPGSVGTYEGTMTLLLHFLGVSMEKALAISVITRFFTFWVVVVGSALYLGVSKVLKRTSLVIVKK